MADRKPDRGIVTLFPNKFKDEGTNRPYLTGGGGIHVDVLKELMEQTPDENGEVKLESAAWSKVSQKGDKYIFVTFEAKKHRQSAEVPNPSDSEDIPF